MLILRLISRHIARRKMQSVLFVLGVALGVAVGVAIDLANTAASRAFSLSAESITGETTHQIVGGPSGLDETIYEDSINPRDAIQSAPIIEESVRAITLNEQPLTLLGVDVQAEIPFRDYLQTIREENAEPSREQLATLRDFVTSQDAALISRTLAERNELTVGDTLAVRINAQRVELRIIALLDATDQLDEAALDDLLIMDLNNAQTLLDMPDRLTRIDLIVPDDAALDALRADLPEGVSIIRPALRAEALAQMTEAFEINLRALSLLALVVGIFLIYNTVMFSVVQRRQVIGIMRSLGTSKRQIFRIVIGEALLLGSLGTVLGLGLGVVMGQGTVDAVSQTVSDLYFRVNVQEVTIPPQTMLTGAVVGIVGSFLAATIPAIDATRTTPAGSMRRSDLEQNTARLVPYITGVGAVMIIAGVLILQIPTENLIISFAGLFLVVDGAALFTPLGMIVLMRIFTPLTGALFGVLGRMAPRSVVRSLSRTAVAVAALTLSVSVIVGVGLMIGSFRATVADWLQTSLGADIFISTPALSTDSTPDIDPTLADDIAQIEGVAEVPVVRNVEVIAPEYPDLPPAQVTAISADIARGERRFEWQNLPAGQSYFEALEAGQVMVTEPFAYRRDITPDNNTITLMTDQGPQTFEVIGVFYDYTSDRGSLFMHLDTYRAYYDDPFITSLAVFAEPDADIDALMERLRDDVVAGLELDVQSNRQIREGALEIFDRTFSITVALQILAIIVAFIGILSALMALQLEHVREYGIMRANGMTPGQIRQLTLIQTGLMGVVAGLLALPIGVALAYILIDVINIRSFGWSMPLRLPPGEFIQAFAVAVLAALLAGAYPAWRVSRISTAEALRGE
ncbi:MAG: FtsX-like permease family protein [Anaerolineales bacterium]